LSPCRPSLSPRRRAFLLDALFYLPSALAGACRGQDSRSFSRGAPSPVSGAPAGSDRQSDGRPSRSVGMDLVCVTLRWRGMDSNHQYRVSRSRVREGVMSAPLDSSPTEGSRNGEPGISPDGADKRAVCRSRKRQIGHPILPLGDWGRRYIRADGYRNYALRPLHAGYG